MKDGKEIKDAPKGDALSESGTPGQGEPVSGKDEKKHKKHLIRPAWLRIPLKILMWLVIIILLIPILIYIPPVQDLAVSIARKEVKKSTGMDIGIGKFRLKFPLDVKLLDVYVVTAPGDTMVSAGEAIADVKLLPLLSLDLQINKLDLIKGYFKMTLPDSSMTIALRAGQLTVDNKSSMNLKTNRLLLNKAKLKDGALSLYMDVWKKKKQENSDTAVTAKPFYIGANDLELENFTFGMSMLPTIDTLTLNAGNVKLKNGVVDLAKNIVSWKYAGVADGSFRYIQPTAEYIKTHPAPPSEPSEGPPMQILGDSISLTGFQALYATKGATPQPGFDPAYIAVGGVEIGMRNFYNEASTVRLPLTRLKAKERSGLEITSGRGLIGIDSIGLKIENVLLNTLWSTISANADVPFAMMAMDENSPMNVKANGSLGLPDIETALPLAAAYTKMIPGRNPLMFDIDAAGTLASLKLDKIFLEMPGVLFLKASGFADHALDYKKMVAGVTIDGELKDAGLANKFIPDNEIKIPAFTIKGTAHAMGQEYETDIKLLTGAGDVAADGKVSLTSERYYADIELKNVNVAQFMPSLGIGHVSGTVNATGSGFNPLKGKATTDAHVLISGIEYKNNRLRDIRIDAALLADGTMNVKASSPNPGLNLDLEAGGTIKPDLYDIDLRADIRDLNLQTLGLSDSLNCGSGIIYLCGTASPERWLYDADLKLENFDWNLPNMYLHLPEGITAYLKADEISTMLNLDSHLTNVHFESPRGMKGMIDAFMASSDTIMAQLKRKNVNIEGINHALPPFDLTINASGRGLLNQFLSPSDIRIDTIWADISRDSLIHGNINVRELNTASVKADTINLLLSQRGSLLDYRAHMGNRPGTFDQFARVNLNGYLGNNRVGAFMTQQNIKGETGYRLGLTAALNDSIATVHFTPLKATIAYMPWSINNDNYIDLNLKSRTVQASLLANSSESSILIKTETNNEGVEDLHLKIDNLKIQDFLSMSVLAPPIQASINTDLRVNYEDRVIQGGGLLSVKDFIYKKTKVGDFDLDLKAGYGMSGANNTNVNAALRINGDPALALYASLRSDSTGSLTPDSIGLHLTRFPLKLANPFLDNMAKLGGVLNGEMKMSGTFMHPLLNGKINFDSVSANVPMLGITLNLDRDPLKVTDNVVHLDSFNIFGTNKNPLTLNGTVDATKFSNILFDLTAGADNMQLLNSDKRSKADLYGKIFVTLNAKAKGPMRRLDISGNVDILGTTDATYRLNMDPAELQTSKDEDVVKFVNFNDTTQVAVADSVVESPLSMRINANLRISPGARMQVLLSTNGTDKVQLQPTADLNYSQNYMGDMNVTGTLTLGEGMARYALPILGEKSFDFEPQSTITWSGNVMNPNLNVTAVDHLKANVTQDGNSRLVNFLVTLKATGSLEQLKVGFDLGTNDDLTIQNELQSMSADQRQTQAMNLLLYGRYQGQGTKANANIDGNILYSYLESTLNSWAAKNIRGVDLSFGVNQYDRTVNGSTSTTTSYSYQVSKSLFNNRFKILVGGNYSTDTSAEDNLAQNLFSDVSFEYILKQTQTLNMSVQLFRHYGYESILEGEITEMGVGFIMKRKLGDLRSLFRFRRNKKKENEEKVTENRDSITEHGKNERNDEQSDKSGKTEEK